MKLSSRSRIILVAGILASVAIVAVALLATRGGGDGTITIELRDFRMVPPLVQLERGQEVRIKVVNKGLTSHDLKLQGKSGSQVLPPGFSEVITIGPFDSSLQAWCTIEGHRALGMEMTFEVVEAR